MVTIWQRKNIIINEVPSPFGNFPVNFEYSIALYVIAEKTSQAKPDDISNFNLAAKCAL